jgi:hypothetical protein
VSPKRVEAIGELDICVLCDESPHKVGCPCHSSYADECIAYYRTDDEYERGTASFWVEDTFMCAALDCGEEPVGALAEAIEEFTTAVYRHELQRVRSPLKPCVYSSQ